MEPIVVLPAKDLKELIERYEKAVERLIEADRELAVLKDDQYVTWKWVCQYFGITRPTATAMLSNEKIFVYGQQIKRFRKAAILKFEERNSIKVCSIGPLPHQDKLRGNK